MLTWAEGADWSRRTSEWGELVTLAAAERDVVAARYLPANDDSTWADVAQQWQRLPEHPALLRLVESDYIQYAAIDWNGPRRIHDDEHDAVRETQWASQVVSLFSMALYTVPSERWHLLARPFAVFDLRGNIRIGFGPVGDVRTIDDAGIVIALRRLLDRHSQRSGSHDKALETIKALCRSYSYDRMTTASERGWRYFERALGWYQIGRFKRAWGQFRLATLAGVWPANAADGMTACVRELAKNADILDDVVKESAVGSEPDVDWLTLSGGDSQQCGFRAVHVPVSGAPCWIYEPGGSEADAWLALIEAWKALPPRPNLLTLVSRHGARSVLLRYAAIAWAYGPPRSDVALPRWVRQLVDALRPLLEVDERKRPLFARPVAKIDICGQIRVWFEPPRVEDLPPGSCDERWLVGMIARLLDAQRVAPDRGSVVAQSAHYATLEQLENLFANADGDIRAGERWEAWQCSEAGIAYVQARMSMLAYAEFRKAALLRGTPLPQPKGRSQELRIPLVPYGPVARKLDWTKCRSEIEALVRERAFDAAVVMLDRVTLDPQAAADVFAFRASCLLELHQPSRAADDALRALDLEPMRGDAHALLVRAHLDAKAHVDALAQADRWLGDAPYDAMGHYLRGKALIGLGRLEDARDAFDLALALKATLLEALMLRRQVDDNLRKLGKAVGSQRTSLVVPETLEHLREVIASGRSKDIIEALTALPDDLDAQLMLARYLGFGGEHDRALVVYERLIGTRVGYAAMVGKATVLFEQGHFEAALAYFDVLVAERRDDTDASEGRARTLEKLGRIGEAAAEFRRLVALASAESGLRVRAARIWLDSHPL